MTKTIQKSECFCGSATFSIENEQIGPQNIVYLRCSGCECKRRVTWEASGHIVVPPFVSNSVRKTNKSSTVDSCLPCEGSGFKMEVGRDGAPIRLVCSNCSGSGRIQVNKKPDCPRAGHSGSVDDCYECGRT